MKRHLKLLALFILPSLFFMGLYGCDGCTPGVLNSGRIVFASGRDGDYEIYIMKPDGTNLIKVTDNTASDYYPSFSKDGTRIVFVSERDGNPEVYLINSDGTNQTRLTDEQALDYHPNFSPDGKKIVFQSRRDGDDEIYLLDTTVISHPQLSKLTNNSDYDRFPSFSPDPTFRRYSIMYKNFSFEKGWRIRIEN